MDGGVTWQGTALLVPHGRRWQRWPVRQRQIVGSGPGAQLRLDRAGIATSHCRLRPEEEGLLISALAEGTDTLVAGASLSATPQLQRPGQVLRVGGLPLVAARDGVGRGRTWLQVGELGSGCPRMWSALASLAIAAPSPWPVLIAGETGTGKELAARLVHRFSPRGDKPWVALNCAAFNDGTLQAELFGATRGAYTGSVQDRRGAFERADGGTLFLDEIGELPLNAQAALLRVLESGDVQVVGGGIRIVDVRLIAATNRDLSVAVAQGRFRADLLHRLAVTHVCLPSLRRRGHDAALLLERFLDDRALPDGASELLAEQRWPGNVRELLNLSRRLHLSVGGGAVTLDDLRSALGEEPTASKTHRPTEVDKLSWVRSLLSSEPTVSAAWRRSGMSRTTFYRYVRRVRASVADMGLPPELVAIA